MKLERDAREFYDPGPVTVPPVDPDSWLASFDGGDTWHEPTDVVNDRPRWLLAGPEADPGTSVAVITLDRVRPRLKTEVPPEVVVEEGPFIWLT